MHNASAILNASLSKEPDLPTVTETIELINRFHAFSDKDAQAWKSAVSELIISYRSARELTRIRDPSIQSYQQALVQLSQAEEGRLRMLVGQFPPHAAHWFAVKAFWVTGKILLLLAEAISSAISKMRADNGYDPTSIVPWEQLGEFLLLRGVIDSEKACKIATRSEAWNKVIKCQVLSLRADYELVLYRTNVATNRDLLSDPKTIKELEDLCSKNINKLQDQQISVQQEYLKKWGSPVESGRQEWVQDNFICPTNIILKYWGFLKQSIVVKTRCNAKMEANELAILDSCLDGPRRARASCVPIPVPLPPLPPSAGLTTTAPADPRPSTIGAPHSSGNRGGAPLPFSSNRSRGTYRRGVPAPRLDNTQCSKAEVGPSNVASQANAPTPGDSVGGVDSMLSTTPGNIHIRWDWGNINDDITRLAIVTNYLHGQSF
ncbi:hypothetical protein OPQ81_003192 [Rhizoctonia solani]|nr:hypothetical protein OPQ81_003192 [Rhizoctonia solani]